MSLESLLKRRDKIERATAPFKYLCKMVSKCEHRRDKIDQEIERILRA